VIAGDLTVDFARRIVTLRGEDVKLTKTEYEQTC
jgi:DNA-binding response OmpR family regulator